MAARIELPHKPFYNQFFPDGVFNFFRLVFEPAELLRDQHYEHVGDEVLEDAPPFGLIVQPGRLLTDVRVRFPDGNEIVFPVNSRIKVKPIPMLGGNIIELQSDQQGQPIQGGGRRRRVSRRHRRVSRRRRHTHNRRNF